MGPRLWQRRNRLRVLGALHMRLIDRVVLLRVDGMAAAIGLNTSLTAVFVPPLLALEMILKRTRAPASA